MSTTSSSSGLVATFLGVGDGFFGVDDEALVCDCDLVDFVEEIGSFLVLVLVEVVVLPPVLLASLNSNRLFSLVSFLWLNFCAVILGTRVARSSFVGQHWNGR